MQPSNMPLMTYIIVACTPNEPRNMATATSLTKGEVIRNDSVTPSGMPPLTKPMNSGTDEQEQKGVTAPNKEANRYCRP